MTVSRDYIEREAKNRYPKDEKLQMAFINGFLNGVDSTYSPKDNDFFVSVATGLRELWPPGEKDGKYPWRDSIPNLVKRLEFIWKERDISRSYTVEDCLTAGKRYLTQFEHNTKYMQVLKYFIFKQKTSSVSQNGKVTYTYKSTLCDMLESNPVVSTSVDENLLIDYENQGELV